MNKVIFYILTFITLIMSPMLLTSSLSDHSNVIECGLTIVLLFVCLILGNNTKVIFNRDRTYSYIVFMFLFFIITVLYHITYIKNDEIFYYLQDLLSFIFFIVAFRLFEKNDLNSLYNSWYKFLCLVCGIVIVCFILYNGGMSFLFLHRNVMGYDIAQIPLVCMMHVDDAYYNLSRPSWLFAEPSYLGFFLGLQIPLFVKFVLNNKTKGRRLFPLLLYLGAIVVTNSLTCIVASVISGLYFLIDKKMKIKKLYLVTVIPVSLVFLSTVNLGDFSNNERIENSSAGNRQLRLVMALDDISQMSRDELLWGAGKYRYEENVKNHEAGYANAYLSMLMCYGGVFVLLYMFLLVIVFKRTSYEFMFVLVGLNSTEISLKPIIFFIFIITYFAYQANQQQHINKYRGKVFKNSDANLVIH